MWIWKDAGTRTNGRQGIVWWICHIASLLSGQTQQHHLWWQRGPGITDEVVFLSWETNRAFPFSDGHLMQCLNAVGCYFKKNVFHPLFYHLVQQTNGFWKASICIFSKVELPLKNYVFIPLKVNCWCGCFVFARINNMEYLWQLFHSLLQLKTQQLEGSVANEHRWNRIHLNKQFKLKWAV